MEAVREFTREDIPQVAGLWLRAFHQRSASPSKALQDYFREIFFESPWADPELPSLVYENDGSRVAGFLGVIPRRMSFRGGLVRAAVCTQLMVEQGARGYPAAKLMRRFLAGRQDLSYSDGANDESERLWLACGGDIARLHSLAWTRVLRPLQYARSRLSERVSGAYGLAAAALAPLCHAADAMAVRTGPGLRWLPQAPDGVVVEYPSEANLLWCIEHLGGARSLAPCYDLDTFRWLLQRAAEKRRYGPLHRAVVRLANGQIAGWYLYYLQRGATAEVLQFGARPGSVPKVLDCLFHHALAGGAIAVSGGLQARYTKEIAGRRCQFSWPGCAVVVHSRSAEILDAVHRGDAFLTRLEGEWWARFSDPHWALDGSPLRVDGAATAPVSVNEVLISEVKA